MGFRPDISSDTFSALPNPYSIRNLSVSKTMRGDTTTYEMIKNHSYCQMSPTYPMNANALCTGLVVPSLQTGRQRASMPENMKCKYQIFSVLNFYFTITCRWSGTQWSNSLHIKLLCFFCSNVILLSGFLRRVEDDYFLGYFALAAKNALGNLISIFITPLCGDAV